MIFYFIDLIVYHIYCVYYRKFLRRLRLVHIKGSLKNTNKKNYL